MIIKPLPGQDNAQGKHPSKRQKTFHEIDRYHVGKDVEKVADR